MMRRLRASKWSLAAAVALVSISVLANSSGGHGLPRDSASSTTRERDSGINGEVRIGPTCPVERPGKVCERPYRATITIRREPRRTLVARVQSSAEGRFRIPLAPGRYLLLPHNGRAYPRSAPQIATVHSHRYTAVLISYDSGIR